MNDLELLVNDLSINGQFPDIPSFLQAIDNVMDMRVKARQFGQEMYCHRNLAYAQVTKEQNMRQAFQSLAHAKRSVLVQWLTQHGPYWEDERTHDPGDYLECNDQVVTDTAIGEAAFRRFNGSDYRLVSLLPSSWEYSPLSVWWRLEGGDDRNIEVANHTTAEELEAALRIASPPITSWNNLADVARERFPSLTFSGDAFDPFRGHPFVPGAALRIIERLEILEKMKGCFDASGERTQEGQRLYQEYFTGENAWFSDSSDPEKHDFKSALTFKHPGKAGETLFCSMHGKVKTPQIRVHFSWPISKDAALYIVYVGPKITKR